MPGRSTTSSRSAGKLLLGLLLALSAVPNVGRAQATQYTFTTIADTLNNDSGLGGVRFVGMNNLGAVIVVFAPSGSNSLQLWRGSGQTFTQVAPSLAGLAASINDFGETAYMVSAIPGTSSSTLVKNSNGTLSTLASYNTQPALNASATYLPSLSNGGSAVFVGTGPGIYVGPSGPIVYDPASDPLLTFASPASMNDSNAVAFVATSAIGTAGIYRGSAVPLIESGDVVSGGTMLITPFTRPVINNSGTVAFVGRLDVGGATGVYGVYTTADGASVTLVGTNPVSQISINDSGAVAFRGADGGIYLGRPGTLDHTVIRPDDAIDGSTLLSAEVWEDGLNNRGQVAFRAQLADGRWGVYRADPVNHPPVAQDDTSATPEDTQYNGTLTASDADSDPLTYSIVTNGTKGVATVIDPTTGAFTYVPNLDENGPDNFTFMANDGQADSNVATLSVTILPVNDAPVASDGVTSVNAGATVSGTLVAADVDSASLSYSVVANGAQGSATVTNPATGAYTYSATIGASGTDTFTFQASDAALGSNVATVTVTIQAPCAHDETALVSVTLGSLRLDKRSGHYLQRVTLRNTNTSLATIRGPVSFVLDSLTAGATVVGAAGVTSCAAPAGSPYITVNVGADGNLTSRERATVDLEFTLQPVNPGSTAITFVPRILAGVGSR